MELSYAILFPILICLMFILLSSIIIYYWFHRAQFFKSSDDLSLWSLFDCRNFSFCKRVLSSNHDNDNVLKGHMRTYVMIWNIWTYAFAIIFFLLNFIATLFEVFSGSGKYAPNKAAMCRHLMPVVNLAPWLAASALLEYFLLRSLELHISLGRQTRFWRKLNLIAFYLLCFLNVLLAFSPYVYYLNEDNICKRISSETRTHLRVGQEILFALLMLISWSLFAEPLFSLRRSITSLNDLNGDMAEEQKRLKRNVDHTVCRTSITSISVQIIYLVSGFVFAHAQNADSSNRELYLCVYQACFALLTCTINLSYHDFGQRCCPLYFYYIRTPLPRGVSDINTASTSAEKGFQSLVPHHTNPVSIDMGVSLNTALEVKSIVSTTGSHIDGSPPPPNNIVMT